MAYSSSKAGETAYDTAANTASVPKLTTSRNKDGTSRKKFITSWNIVVGTSPNKAGTDQISALAGT